MVKKNAREVGFVNQGFSLCKALGFTYREMSDKP